MKSYFWKIHIIMIQKKSKFQKMCIKVHDASNIKNTWFEMFDLAKIQHEPM
jgi:hypothetical protein